MADLSSITLPNGATYNFKDNEARTLVNGKQDSIGNISGVLAGNGNGGIMAAQTTAANSIAVESTPTSGSSNLVTSGGTRAAIDSKITSGTTDLTPGTSALATGVVYLVYE